MSTINSNNNTPEAYVDITTIRAQLDEVERRMRETVVGAEKRLGMDNVVKAFRLIGEAENALRELSIIVHPDPPVKERMSAEELMARGYM